MKLATLVAVALGAGLVLTTPPRPPFAGPITSAPEATRMVVVSSRTISPGTGGATSACDLTGPPRAVRGRPLQRTFCPGGTAFALYGSDGASARILLAFGPQGGFRYGLDFKHYVWPPRIQAGEREFVYEEVVWARVANGVLYVENAHWTYATSSYGRNAYVTAFDLTTKRRLWRSRALVANARTFVVTGDYLVAGYGFTAEEDWLYLLDRRTGRVVERLKLPSAPERITRKRNLLKVRTYDHIVTVRLRES